jgi:hypothetical protein
MSCSSTVTRWVLQAGLMGLCLVATSFGQIAATAGATPHGWQFTENRGQWPGDVLFAGSRAGATIRLERDGAVLRLADGVDVDAIRGVVLHLTWAAGAVPETPEGSEELPGRSHFLFGSDPARWRSNVPSYGRVTYGGVSPGVDLAWRDRDGRLEFDVGAEPGAEVEPLVFRWEGADEITLADDGSLVLHTPLGDVRQTPPVAWEEDEAGSRRTVESRYRLLDGERFAFQATRQDPTARLVIDPGLDWSTLLGGSHQDQVKGLDLAEDGTVTVATQTLSIDFPTTPGAFDTTYASASGSGIWDAVVSRFDASGSVLEFSTYLGGAGSELVGAVAVAANGETVISGWTSGASFPTTPGAFDTSFAGPDAFVTRLTADGSGLVFSTFVGGSSLESCYGMSLSLDGGVALCGVSLSADFPATVGAFDTTNEGMPIPGDAYVAKISPAGDALLYATLLGGSAYEEANAVGLMSDGSVVVAGRAGLIGIPWTTNLGVGLFVAHFDSTLSSLLYATSLGGSGDDRVHDLALDATGAAYLTGWTMSPDFLTTAGVIDPTYNGNKDSYVLKVDPTGSTLVYSTYLGGGAADLGGAIAVDSGGVATVSGFTLSSTFPTTAGAFMPSIQGGTFVDAFVSRLNPTGSGLWYSTFLGGSSGAEGTTIEERSGLALGPEGEVVVGSYTKSTDFPTTPGAFDETANGMQDGFVAKLDMLPTGAQKSGISTPGCAGPLAIGVTAMPQVGKPFGLTCTNAPASSGQGILVLGLSALSQPGLAKGAQFWVNPAPVLLLLPAGSNALGLAWLQGTIPNAPGLVGASFAVQFFWPNGCGPAGSLSASNALVITIQP